MPNVSLAFRERSPRAYAWRPHPFCFSVSDRRRRQNGLALWTSHHFRRLPISPTTVPAATSISRNQCAAELAIFDFDNDGRLDIFLTNGAQLPEMKKTNPSYYNSLLKQRADGTFEDVTSKAGLLGESLDFNFGVAVGDYDNDGYEDLFISSAGRNTLYHNNGDGTFTDVTQASGIGTKPPGTLSVAAAWFDYDNDGLLDLIVSNYTIWTPQTDFRCTMGSEEYYCDPRRYKNVPPRLYHNLGNGKFEDVTEKSGLAKYPGKGMGISIADFNDDGWPDIFIANDTEPNSLFINMHNGTFARTRARTGSRL